MGTPELAVPALEALIHSEHEVVGVFAQPDEPAGRGRSVVSPPIKKLALQHRLTVHQPALLRWGSDQRARSHEVYNTD